MLNERSEEVPAMDGTISRLSILVRRITLYSDIGGKNVIRFDWWIANFAQSLIKAKWIWVIVKIQAYHVSPRET